MYCVQNIQNKHLTKTRDTYESRITHRYGMCAFRFAEPCDPTMFWMCCAGDNAQCQTYGKPMFISHSYKWASPRTWVCLCVWFIYFLRELSFLERSVAASFMCVCLCAYFSTLHWRRKCEIKNSFLCCTPLYKWTPKPKRARKRKHPFAVSRISVKYIKQRTT